MIVTQDIKDGDMQREKVSVTQDIKDGDMQREVIDSVGVPSSNCCVYGVTNEQSSRDKSEKSNEMC
jgi:hypothetical protein